MLHNLHFKRLTLVQWSNYKQAKNVQGKKCSRRVLEIIGGQTSDILRNTLKFPVDDMPSHFKINHALSLSPSAHVH